MRDACAKLGLANEGKTANNAKSILMFSYPGSQCPAVTTMSFRRREAAHLCFPALKIAVDEG